MPGIISDLKAAGYTFVSVSELVPGARAGDIIYNRTSVIPYGTASTSEDTIVLEDGRRLGQVLDEAPAPGRAPLLTTTEAEPTRP